MSLLSVALEQIQRPSFLPVFVPSAPTRRKELMSAEMKRAMLLDALRAAGEPVHGTWLMDYTDFSRSSVQHQMLRLVESGLVIRSMRWVDGRELAFWSLKNGN